MLVAGVIGLGLFAIQERLVPESTRRAEAIREQIRGRPASSFRQLSRSWVLGRSGTIYHFDSLDLQRGQLRGLSIFEFVRGEWRLSRRIAAREAINRPDPEDAPSHWIATAGEIWSFSNAGVPSLTRAFSHTALRLEPIDYFKADRPEADRMSYFELERYIGDLRAGGTNVTPYVVALYRKLSFPFVTIVMTLLAVPFAVTTGKRGAVHGIGVGAGLAFAYWTAMSMFGALGSAGAVIPVLAAWAPSLLFGAGALYLVLRTPT
jgi:lipopolysaccharide export LptBFGC system permease protein LptF